MPVEGIPDANQHCLCVRCRQWFLPSDVKPFAFSRTILAWLRPISGMSPYSRPKFICNGCDRRGSRRRVIFWGTLVAVVGLLVLLKAVGVLPSDPKLGK